MAIFFFVQRLSFVTLALFLIPSAGQAQLTNGFTYTRQQGLSTSSAAGTVVLSGSRVLGESITQPENVIALPLVSGQLEQFQIIDKTRRFGVADQTVSSTSESTTNQKTLGGFTGFGYSVFAQPQY
jgi:hypothetical protein